jgi:hypothetical protein
MDIDHIPNTMDPLMHNMLHNENYWFFYEALTKHDVIDLDHLPKPNDKPGGFSHKLLRS